MTGVDPLPTDWPLVGRSTELVDVETALRGGGAVLAGPAGVGKTRLAREALARARVAGRDTEWLAVTRDSEAIPFGAVCALLAPDDPLNTPPAEFLRRTTRHMAVRAERLPVLVAVDDAHLLDGSSASVLHQLTVRGLISLLATVRTGESAPDAITALWKDGLVRRVRARPLGSPAIAELLALTLGPHIEGVTRQRIRALAAGNPLLLRELLIGAHEDGALVRREGVWILDRAPRRGTGLAEMIEARLRTLDGTARTVVEIVAFGEPLPAAELDRLAGHVPLPPGAVEAAERTGLVVGEVSGRRRTLRMAHPLHGEVVRGMLSGIRARTIHGWLVRGLEGQPRRRRDDGLRLVRWQLEAGAAARPETLLDAAHQAVEHADLGLAVRLVEGARNAEADRFADDGRLSGQILARMLARRERRLTAETAPADGAGTDMTRTEGAGTQGAGTDGADTGGAGTGGGDTGGGDTDRTGTDRAGTGGAGLALSRERRTGWAAFRALSLYWASTATHADDDATGGQDGQGPGGRRGTGGRAGSAAQAGSFHTDIGTGANGHADGHGTNDHADGHGTNDRTDDHGTKHRTDGHGTNDRTDDHGTKHRMDDHGTNDRTDGGHGTNDRGADDRNASVARIVRAWALLGDGRCRDALDSITAATGAGAEGPAWHAQPLVVVANAFLGNLDLALTSAGAGAGAGAANAAPARDAPPPGGVRWGVTLVDWSRCLALRLAGRMRAAAALAEHGYDVAVTSGVREAAIGWAGFRGGIAKAQGQVVTAQPLLREALAALDGRDAFRLRGFFLGDLAGAAALTGDATAATRLMQRADAMREGSSRLCDPWIELNRAWVIAARGDATRAARQARRAADLAREIEQYAVEAIALYDAARLGAVRSMLARHDELATTVDGPLVPILNAAANALAADDGRALDSAAAALEDLGLALHATELARAAALAHEAAGRASAAAASRRRMIVLLGRCEGARTPMLTDVRPGPLSALSPREREIARLAAAGLSSKAIAVRLSLSRRTVDNHLGRAYHKLGVSGRAELSVLLRPAGDGSA